MNTINRDQAIAAAPSAWQPLRQRLFLSLWLASIASSIGTWMHEVGAGWLMTSLSASPLMVALVQVAGAAPMFLLALPAGALADIIDKRKYLLMTQAGMAVVALVLAILTFAGMMSAPLLLLFTLAMGVGTALTMPAWSALTPEVVPAADLPAAISLSSVGVNVARALGPAIAGIIISLVGPWATFAVNALSFFAVITVLAMWRRTPQQPVLPAERLFGAIRVGWRYARSSNHLQRVLVRTLLFFLGASAGMSLLPLIVRGELKGSAEQFGILLGCVGVGAVAGAMFLPWLRRQIAVNQLVALASLTYAAVLLALAWVPNFYGLIPVMLISGAAWIAVLSSLQVSAQTSVPAWVKARALAVYILVFFGTMAVGGLVWGLLASWVSISVSLSVAGGVMIAGVAVGWWVKLPVLVADDLAPSLHWPQPLLSADVDGERGPVMITVEYEIAPADAEAFKQAMEQVRRMRNRNGSFSWQLMQDTENPNLWIELFFDESWLDHLRHHGRVTRSELKIESSARRFLMPGTQVRIRHLLKG
ncbi:MFS transporter [Pseudomonas sp. REP124]|uniref:MFS transporter n=1 Tax=Pseudomonas sp. REP124 TaxID=2875731 RepID=UPI001CCC1632|nr:MFS transporter [Pseudomonas sp. REP124]MBZ9780949.1 MFS transporter [Pseudomonas sp. REP124]